MRILILSLLMFCGLKTVAQALETDRPDQTESSATVPKGSIQIETGAGVELIENSITQGTDRLFLIPSTLFRIALAHKFELRLVNTLMHTRSALGAAAEQTNQWGIDDLQIGFKSQFAKGDGIKPQISLMAHAVIPTGSLKKFHYGAVTKLLVSHDFNNGWGLGYNFGYNYFGAGDGDFTYSIAFGAPVTEKVGVYVEAYGEYTDFSNYQSSADAGLTFLVRPHIQLDYSFGVGINYRMNYQAIGLSIRFPKSIL